MTLNLYEPGNKAMTHVYKARSKPMDDYRVALRSGLPPRRCFRGRALAVLAREYQLAAHLQDRAGIPQVLARYGAAAMREIAIAEWMGASPVYTQRMQRALGFAGDDVATIFKGMQFDVGAPHGFLDFRFRVNDDGSGEFWLPYCGALMDVEPMGEEFVVGMCHHIEDPTFDATAVATNPRAQVRPIHRPPRVPADRDAALPLARAHRARRGAGRGDRADAGRCGSRASRSSSSRHAAHAPSPAASPTTPGPFDPDLQLEDLAHAAARRASLRSSACRATCWCARS